MGGSRTPGAVGLDPDAADVAFDEVHQPILGIGEGAQNGAEPLDNRRKIKTVTRNWGDPPKARVATTPEVAGKTLAEALKELEKLPEWGTGGGNLSGTGENGVIELSTTDGKNYTCEIKGDFFITLPGWKGYTSATPAQKQAWDDMISQLRKHEEEHVAIAYRGAQKLIQALTNLSVDLAMQKIQESGQATQDAQDDFDSEGKTHHGKKPWGGFPKVELDVSADPPPPPPPPPPKTK
jgi:hypothetical protein